MGGGLCLNGAWGYSALASQDTSRKVLARAAALVGIDALAGRLQISARVLRHYLTGFELIPEHLFLKAVDVIVEHLPNDVPGPEANAAGERPSKQKPKAGR